MLTYVYVYGEYQDNVDVNESTLHVYEDVNEALFHPMGSYEYDDGAHHADESGYETSIRGYENGHVFR